MGAVALRAEDLRVMNNEPRVLDYRLGEVLGYARPRKARTLVQRNAKELAMHGDLTLVPLKNGPQADRHELVYHLNEAQALLVCMFARTDAAAAARKNIIDVFLAYRHGKLVPSSRQRAANDRDEPWAKMAQRNARLRDAAAAQALVDDERFTRVIGYVPTVLFLQHADGRRRKQTRPRWWHDLEVRREIIAMHRQMPMHIAVQSLAAQFGKARAPSRSSIGRFWQVLDEVRAAS